MMDESGILPRQESFASLHILTRCASEGSEALPSLARRVSMSFFGARVIRSAFRSNADLTGHAVEPAGKCLGDFQRWLPLPGPFPIRSGTGGIM